MLVFYKIFRIYNNKVYLPALIKGVRIDNPYLLKQYYQDPDR
jgi:hypothetical protein